MGNNFHYVTYPVNNDNEPCNFIGVLKYKLTTNELNNYDLFKEKTFVKAIKDKLKNKISTIILDNIDNFKCFPVFVSKGYLKPGKNIFLVGDAFLDRKSTRLNSSHGYISYAVFCLKKKKI